MASTPRFTPIAHFFDVWHFIKRQVISIVENSWNNFFFSVMGDLFQATKLKSCEVIVKYLPEIFLVKCQQESSLLYLLVAILVHHIFLVVSLNWMLITLNGELASDLTTPSIYSILF